MSLPKPTYVSRVYSEGKVVETSLYSEAQMLEYRNAALEDAVKVVLADAVKNPVTAYQLQYNMSLQHTANDIRALIGETNDN